MTLSSPAVLKVNRLINDGGTTKVLTDRLSVDNSAGITWCLTRSKIKESPIFK